VTHIPPDPNLEDAIDIALARMAPGLSASQADAMRKSVRFALVADPTAQEVLRRLGARPYVKRSGTVCSRDVREDEDEGEAKGTGGGR
jgi:hypothetical protein